MVMRLDIL